MTAWRALRIGTSWLMVAALVGLYLLALPFDLSDRQVFALTDGLVSGHTLKHGVAALATLWVARYLRTRRAIP